MVVGFPAIDFDKRRRYVQLEVRLPLSLILNQRQIPIHLSLHDAKQVHKERIQPSRLSRILTTTFSKSRTRSPQLKGTTGSQHSRLYSRCSHHKRYNLCNKRLRQPSNRID